MKPNKDVPHFLKMKASVHEGYVPPNGAAIHAMTEGEICQEIARTVAISHGAFRTLGKLRYELEEKTGTAGIYAKLAEYGVEAEDISNAGPAAITYREMVIPGHMSEEHYDGISFGLCRAITRVMGKSPKSPTKVTLTGEAIAEMAKAYRKKNALQRELESIAAEGMTIAEFEAHVVAQAAAAAEAAKSAPPAEEPTPKPEIPESAPKKTPAASTPAPSTPSPSPSATESDADEEPEEFDAPEAPTAPKAQPKAASGYAKIDGIVTELEKSMETDGLDLNHAEAGKLCERLAAMAQVLAEFAAASTPDTNPRTPNGKETHVALPA